MASRVFWLYRGLQPIYAVTAPPDSSDSDVRARALAQLEICPTVYVGYPTIALFEFAAMVRAANVLTF